MKALLLLACFVLPPRAAAEPASQLLEYLDERPIATTEDDATYARWSAEIRRAGGLAAWVDAQGLAPRSEDAALLARLKPLMPAARRGRIIFLYPPDGVNRTQDELFRLLDFANGRNAGITFDKDTGAGVVFIGDLPQPKKTAVAVHEGVHLEHKSTTAQHLALEAAYARLAGRSPEMGVWSKWLEEGYTEWLTRKRLAGAGEAIPKDGVYDARVKFVDALIAAAGEEVVESFCVRADPAPLLAFLGPRRTLLLLRVLEDLSLNENMIGSGESAGLTLALRVLAARESADVERLAAEYVDGSLRWDLENAAHAAGRDLAVAKEALAPRMDSWRAAYLEDPAAVADAIRAALR